MSLVDVVLREGRIQWQTLMSFCMGFLDKTKAPLFLPPPRTRSFSDFGREVGVFLLQAVIGRTTLDRRQA